MSRALLSSLLPLAVASPIAGAVGAPLIARLSRQAAVAVAVVTLAASGGLLLVLAPTVYGGRVLGHFMGHVVPNRGSALGIAFAADPWGLTFALVTTLLGALLLVYTMSELRELGPRELGAYTALFLLLCAALVGGALTGDLFNLFVWFEVAAIASYALTAFFLERSIALEAAFKILVLTTIASFGIFVGAALVYAATGALNLGQISQALPAHRGAVTIVAFGLLLSGFATKAGIVPFHGWLPDAHEAAPGPVSALFSGLMVNLGVLAVGRLALQVFTPGTGHGVLGLLMVLGLVSAVGGAAFALVQDDLKRLLGYDTVSQMGVLLVGLASGTPEGAAGATYHLVDHALFKALLFLCAGSLVHMTGATKLSEMGALARRYPLLAAAFGVGVLSIAGVPPFDGYVSLGLVHSALRSSHQVVPLVVLLAAQVLTMAALGRAAWLAFLRGWRARPEGPDHLRSLHPGMVGALVLIAAACLGLGLFPGALVREVAAPAASGLLHPTAYASAVLAGGGPLPHLSVAFPYWDPVDLLLVVVTAALALPCAMAATRWAAARPVTLVRRVQTGSVNDYAGYLVAGLLVTIAVLAR
jgi:multicomponent Na+:H+ antiporter subunit D